MVQKHEIIFLWMGQEDVDSGTRCSPERCFDLFQGFAFCLWDESYSEDDIEDAHKSKHPEGSSTGQNILKKNPVQELKLFFQLLIVNDVMSFLL